MHGQINTRVLSTLLANAMLCALIIKSGDEEEAYDRCMNSQSDISSNKSFLRDVELSGASSASYRSNFNSFDGRLA